MQMGKWIEEKATTKQAKTAEKGERFHTEDTKEHC